MPRLKRLIRLSGEYLDLLLAAGVAVTLAILGLVGMLHGDHLTEATVGVLAVLSATLVRDRWRRERLGEAVQDVLAVSRTGKPWEVLSAEFSWELFDAEGRRAQARSNKVVRFLQDEVLTIYEFSRPDGRVTEHVCKGSLLGERLKRDLPVMHDGFPGPRNRRYRIISLENVMRRGQRMEIESVRTLNDSFLLPHESVMVEIEVPTDEITMSITWPADRVPNKVQFARDDEPVTTVGSDLHRLPDGRNRFDHRVSGSIEMGEHFVVSWDW